MFPTKSLFFSLSFFIPRVLVTVLQRNRNNSGEGGRERETDFKGPADTVVVSSVKFTRQAAG